MAGRADVAREFRMDFAELGDFVHGSLKDFFLRIEASAHGPFVEQVEERAGFVEADGFGVGKNVKSERLRSSQKVNSDVGGSVIPHEMALSAPTSEGHTAA